MPSLVNTPSNMVVYLLSRSRIRNRKCPIPHPQHQVAGLLRHPLPVRVGRNAEEVHSAGADLHQEQHVDTLGFSSARRNTSARTSAWTGG
jgi:hypothetical protein